MADDNKMREEMKQHEVRMKNYADEVREYINKHSNDNCDYLIHRRLMEAYHRGAYNALLSNIK